MENMKPSKPDCDCKPNKDCGCVGYAYVPIQMLNNVYQPCEGLKHGTIFPELNLSIEEYGKVCKAVGGIS